MNPSDVRRLAQEWLDDKECLGSTEVQRLMSALASGRLIVTEPPATGGSTPRVDAEVAAGRTYGGNIHVDFARHLELELTALQLRFDAHLRGESP